MGGGEVLVGANASLSCLWKLFSFPKNCWPPRSTSSQLHPSFHSGFCDTHTHAHPFSILLLLKTLVRPSVVIILQHFSVHLLSASPPPPPHTHTHTLVPIHRFFCTDALCLSPTTHLSLFTALSATYLLHHISTPFCIA